MWCLLFGVFGECWVCLTRVEELLHTRFRGFGRKKDWNKLWQCGCFVVLWKESAWVLVSICVI